MKTRNKLAFNLIEVILALVVIAIIVTILASNLSRILRESKIKSISEAFYATTEQSLQQLLIEKCGKNRLITSLEDVNQDGSINAKDIGYYIADVYNGEELSNCSKLVNDGSSKSNLSCFDIAPNGYFGVAYDKTCSTSKTIFESTKTEKRDMSKLCGYIVFSPIGSKGILGEDYFVIPIANTARTKRTIKS